KSAVARTRSPARETRALPNHSRTPVSGLSCKSGDETATAEFQRPNDLPLRGHDGMWLLESRCARLRGGVSRHVSREPVRRTVHRRVRTGHGHRFPALVPFYRNSNRLPSLAARQRRQAALLFWFSGLPASSALDPRY